MYVKDEQGTIREKESSLKEPIACRELKEVQF